MICDDNIDTQVFSTRAQDVEPAEIVDVPTELHEFVLDPKFQSALLKIKEQSGVDAISVDWDENNVRIVVNSHIPENATQAKMLLTLKFKHQVKLQASEDKLRKIQNDLFSTQGSIASGHVVEFFVDQDVVGLIIGKKGARIKQTEVDSGVQSIKVTNTDDELKGKFEQIYYISGIYQCNTHCYIDVIF